MSLTKDVTVPRIAADRLERLKARDARIGVIGLGYVGLPLCLLFAEAGFKVTGFDIDERKIPEIAAGRTYIISIPQAEIQAAVKNGFTATTDFSHLSEQDVIIMCVPTPLTGHREPDLSYIELTAKSTGPWLQEGQLVGIESTTYPGTTEDVLIPLLEAGSKSGLKAATEGNA